MTCMGLFDLDEGALPEFRDPFLELPVHLLLFDFGLDFVADVSEALRSGPRLSTALMM
jgi:hypothetical protein